MNQIVRPASLVPVSARVSPFATEAIHVELPEGLTVAEMVARISGITPAVWTSGMARIETDHGCEHWPVETWMMIRPRRGTRITIAVVPRGKALIRSVLGIAATVAVIAAAVFVPPLLGFAAGSLGASLVGGLIGLGGSLALGAITGALSPAAKGGAPVTDTGVVSFKQLGNAGFQANALEPYEQIGAVIGQVRMAPPLLAPPYVEYDGDDAYVVLLAGLVGRHLFDDLRVNGTPVTDLTGVEWAIRDGSAASGELTLYTQTVKQQRVGRAMSTHNLKQEPTARRELYSEAANLPATAGDWPQAHRFRTCADASVAWFDMSLPQGLITTADAKAGLPFRLRFRRVGTEAWVNCPEIHAATTAKSPMRLRIEFVFAAPSSVTAVGTTKVWGYKIATADDGWTQNSYFAGANTGGVRGNTNAFRFNIAPATFGTGAWEIEITRGAAYIFSRFNGGNNYVFAGTTNEGPRFFTGVVPGSGNVRLNEDQALLNATCVIDQFASTNDTIPVDVEGLSTIEMRLKNTSVESLSAVVHGYVHRLFNGTSWQDVEAPTRNPAAWAYEILTDPRRNARVLPAPLIDTAGLGEWYEYCRINGLTVDAAFGAGSVWDAFDLCAGAGHALKRFWERVGVVIDRDRSAETVRQVFSPRNSQGFTAVKQFSRFPQAVRANYVDNDDDSRAGAEAIVYHDDFGPDTATEVDTVEYKGMTSTGEVERRALMDLRALRLRAVQYTWRTDARFLVSGRGDLVGLNHDVVLSTFGFGIIKSVATAGGLITGFVVDEGLPLLDPGPTGLAITRLDGVTVAATTSQTGPTAAIVLDAGVPYHPDLAPGAHVVAREVGSEYKRLIVQNVRPGPEFTAEISAVDAAPGIFTGLGLLNTGAGVEPETFLATLAAEGLDADLVCVLDMAAAGTWPGSGQALSDLSGAGNHAQLGATSGAEASDPTPTGTAGALDHTVYLAFDGGDYLTFAGSPTFDDNWHKADATFSMLAAVWLPYGASVDGGFHYLFGNRGSANSLETGVVMRFVNGTTSRPAMEVLVSDGSMGAVAMVRVTLPYGLIEDGWNFVGLAVNASTKEVTVYANGHWIVARDAYESPSTGAPSEAPNIAAAGDGERPLAAGSRIALVALADRYLTAGDMARAQARLALYRPGYAFGRSDDTTPRSALAMAQTAGADTGLIVALDPASGLSFPGSGQAITDLSGAGNDFVMGADAVAGSDEPSFAGTAGSLDAGTFWRFRGGNEMLTAGAGATWHNTFHHQDAQWGFACLLFVPPAGLAADSTLFSTFGADGVLNRGVRLYCSTASTQRLSLYVENGNIGGSTWTVSNASDLVTNAWNFVAIGINETGGAGASHAVINRLVRTFNAAISGSETEAAHGLPTIGARVGGADPLPVRARLGPVWLWSQQPASATLLALYKRATYDRYRGLI